MASQCYNLTTKSHLLSRHLHLWRRFCAYARPPLTTILCLPYIDYIATVWIGFLLSLLYKWELYSSLSLACMDYCLYTATFYLAISLDCMVVWTKWRSPGER